jgi:hypothetical protein
MKLIFYQFIFRDREMNISANITHNGKNIFIAAHDAVNLSEIEIKVFAGDGFGVADLMMIVPFSSAKMVTEKFLRMCGEKLLKAQEWND